MKKALFLFMSIALLSFDTKPVSVEALTKQSMVRVRCNYFCGKYEVSNAEWKEYTKFVGEKMGQETESYQNAQPDFTVWRNSLNFNEPLVENYYQHPAFNNYPVIGVSYAQVQDFLKWKTLKMNELLSQSGSSEKVVFRLPTQEEWEEIANCTKKPTLKTKWKRFVNKDKATANFRVLFSPKTVAEGYTITAPVNGLVPNDFGIYNMRGNVAEMIDKEGVAKGGSWVHTEVQSPISQNFEYKEKTAWLGFRYVMEISQ